VCARLNNTAGTQPGMNFSTDPATSMLVIDGRPEPRQSQATETRKPPAPQSHADPYPQQLDSTPDLLLISCAPLHREPASRARVQNHRARGGWP
jgi:hypothetical protein